MTVRFLFSIAFLVMFVISCVETEQEFSLLDAGVPLDLAEYRSSQVNDVVYHLSFDIPAVKEDPIPSTLLLNVTINDLSHPLYLDFKEDSTMVKMININEIEIPILLRNEHIVIPAESLNIGPNSIGIAFTAGELSLNRNADYLYTLLVPDRARTVFPCFDQPNIKAKYNLTITAPKDWEVLCGAPLKDKVEKGDFIKHEFAESDKMSTYLFSFVAGKFTKISSEHTTQDMNMIYRETDQEKISYSVTTIFDLHQSALDFLENYTAYDFPFQKFDFATIPGFQYGGMEHTGAIQYRESSLFLDKSATRTQELSRAKLIAHETAHMWFGNLVTMDWFNDVWMKEVFANFMADKIVNPVFTDINHDLQFLTSHYPRAYGVDRTQGTNPIRQELNNLKNAGSLYGSIIYNKAPIMMRQLELTIGKEIFQEGIQEYIKTYANSNADWNGLIKILDSKTEIDLKNWSEVWVNSSGRPIFIENISFDGDGKINTFILTQKAEDDTDKIWPQTFEIALVYEDRIEKITVSHNKKSVELKEAIGLNKPEHIIYNLNGYGYGLFPTSEVLVAYAQNIEDEVARAHTYINAYENTITALLEQGPVFESLMVALDKEENELVLRLIGDEIISVYWSLLSQKERNRYKNKLESILLTRLKGSTTKNVKKSLFGNYKSIAYSDYGLEMLYGIWNKDIIINNLELNADDYTALAQTLALYNHPESETILEAARSQIKNADKLERFDFLAPALSSDPKVRTEYFLSFKEAKNREKENWTQTACSFIHHPLRQDIGIQSVAMALDILEEIQSTGDIFFPKGWLDNTIGKYTSREAFVIVENYLEKHPELNKSLKQKLLQSTDLLSRNFQFLDDED